MSRYLHPSHPSHDCRQAWFVYAVKDHRGPGFCRLILVEAKGHAAVAFLEIVSADGRASETCELMSVHRGSEVGLRSALAEEVSLRDFAEDMVSPDRLSEVAVSAYGEAVAPGPPHVAPGATEGPVYQTALAGLVELGYKKERAKQMLAGVADVERMSPSDALQAALHRPRGA